MLRRIFGPVKDKELWTMRTNKELMDIYQEKDLVILSKCLRMRWLGHVHRMQSNRRPKRAMEGKPGGRRNRGRPRTRRLEVNHKRTLNTEFEQDWSFTLGATLRDREKI